MLSWRARFLLAVVLLTGCRGERAHLDEAVRSSGSRPFRGRLSGFGWAPPPSVTRSAKAGNDMSQLRVRSVAGQIWRSASNEEIKADAALLAGFTEDAIARLKKLTSTGTASADAWNDWSVALASSVDGDIATLCQALAAADHAIYLDPARHEALFNRAVALDRLSLAEEARQAYIDYLRVDGASPWAAEARERMRAIERNGTTARAWSDLLPEFEREATRGESSRIHHATAAYPQDARIWSETELLGTWGDQVVAGDSSSGTTLAIARAIGQTLRQVGGDELPADAVAAIDASASKERRNRFVQLARAHIVFRDARALYRAREVALAAGKFKDASGLFVAAGSPMHLVARYYLANAMIDMANRVEARRIARDLSTEAPLRYRALHAEIDWLDAILSGMDGFLERALRSFQRASSEFDTLHERESTAEMRDRIAALLTILGRTRDAWQLRRLTFPVAGVSGNPRRVEITLYSAVTDAVHEKNWDVAHALLTLVADVQGGNVRLHAEALVWRPLTAKRASMDALAEREVADARRATSLLHDPGLREDVENELRLVEALLDRDHDPARSVRLFGEHLASATRRGRLGRLPQVLIERARDLRKLGRNSEAESDLRKAIELIETQRATIGRVDIRDSFLGTSTTAYDELADLLDASGKIAGAIEIADRHRARILQDRGGGSSDAGVSSMESELSQRLDSHTALLSYGVFDDRLIVFAATRHGIEHFATMVKSRDQLLETCSRFVTALSEGRRKEAAVEGSSLFQWLIAPAASTLRGIDSLVIVADGVMQTVPFAAINAEDGSFLVERYSIRVAPSVRGYLAARVTSSDAVADSILIVGNPAIDRTRFPGLPPLLASEDEAKRIASLYRSPIVLLSDRATKANVARILSQVSAVHIASHAVVDRINPDNSRLLLAPSGSDDGSLLISEITAMRLDQLRCVVLAGCETAEPAEGFGDLRSLSAAFLAAGTRNVVATLWKVGDVNTEPISIILHRGLRKGMSAAEATRNAQLTMLRSQNNDLANPSVWASMQVYGWD